MQDDPIELIVDSKIRGAEPRPVVARRKIGVAVHLVGGSTLSGEFYASADGPATLREAILERLEEPSERYLPIAAGSRHVLVAKSAILYLESAELGPSPDGGRPGAHTFDVDLVLDSGKPLDGTIETGVRALHYRTLDHLNGGTDRFLRLVRSGKVVYANHAHIVSVTDRTD